MFVRVIRRTTLQKVSLGLLFAAAAALLLKIPASIFNGTVAIVLAPPLCLALRKALQQTNIQLP